MAAARAVPAHPRLELRPDDDAGLDELVAATYAGIHPPGEAPFAEPWTEADPRYLGRGTLQHYWAQRAATRPENWTLDFLVRLGGTVIGVVSLMATDFAVAREVSPGSWVTLRHQGLGYGTDMRAAVLGLAFDHLGARSARSAAWHDNVKSLAVSRKLGYRPDGTDTMVRQGAATTMVRLLLSAEDFAAHRPEWRVAGVAGCLELLGAEQAPTQ